jgi:hypothetical protein
MPFKNNPGCSCCGSDCCKLIIAKPYGGITYTGGVTQGQVDDITGIEDTNFSASWDFSQATSYDSNYPNVLPADSEVTISFTNCCYDYHFEVEVFDFQLNTVSPYANNPAIDIFSEVMQCRIYDNGKTSLYSRANFASDLISNFNELNMFNSRSGSTRKKTYRAVEGCSWIGTGSTCEEIYDSAKSEYRSLTVNDPPAYTTDVPNIPSGYRGIRSVGQLDASYSTSNSRTSRLTLKTHSIPITIGGIVIRLGVNAKSADSFADHRGDGDTSAQRCVRIFNHDPPSTDPMREMDQQDYVYNTDTTQTQTYSGWFGSNQNGNEAHGAVALVRKSGQITKSGYGQTDYSWTMNDEQYAGTQLYSGVTATASLSLDHSIKNGSYDWLLYNGIPDPAFPQQLTSNELLAWETWCENVATDNWQHGYQRPFYHFYGWQMPKICSVWPDPTNCPTSSPGFPHNDIRSECSSTNASATFTKTGAAPVDWFATGTSLPCMYEVLPDFTDFEETFPFNTNGGWEPGNFTKPRFVNTSSGTNKFSSGLNYIFGVGFRMYDPNIWTDGSVINRIDPSNPVEYLVEPEFNLEAVSWYQLDSDMEDRVVGMMLGDQDVRFPSSGSPAGYYPGSRAINDLLNVHFTEESPTASGNLVSGSTTTGSWSVTGGWTGTTKVFWDLRMGRTQFNDCVARVGKSKVFNGSVKSLSITQEVRQDVGGVVTLISASTVSSTQPSYDTNAVYGGFFRNLNPKTDGKFYLYSSSGGNAEGSQWKDKCPSMQDILIGQDEYRVVMSDNALGFWVWNKTTNDVYEPYDASSSHFSDITGNCGERTVEFSTEPSSVAGTRYVIEIKAMESK